MCWALAKAGVGFEKKNPITSLMTDRKHGNNPRGYSERKSDVGHRRNQDLVARTEEIIRLVWEVEKRLDTVVALGVAHAATSRVTKTSVWRKFWSGWDTGWSAPRPISGWAASVRITAEGRQEGSDGMTNTLHRFGDAESFHDDFVVFAIACKGKNDQDALPKLRRFLEIALEYKPVNLGDARHGGALRPPEAWTRLSHWKRDIKPDFQAVINGLDVATTCAAVFDDRVPLRRISSSASKKRVSA